MTLPRPLRLALLGLASLLALLLALLYGLTWRPAERAAATAGCSAPAPVLQPGQALKVLTWNLRHLGGDADGGLAPSLDELARVLREERPDIVLLQELHDGAQTRDRQDPLALLQARLDEGYPCSSQAFYWKAPLTLQPPRLGRIGLKLATLSRYHIESAERVQLPRRPGNPLLQAFAARPALLVSYLPMRGGGRLTAINTQLDAFAPGDDTQRRQLAATRRLLAPLQDAGALWLLGGDFNRTPPGQEARRPRADDGELRRWAEHYSMISSPEQAGSLERLVHSPRLTRLDAQASRLDAEALSGQRPLLARLLLPALD